ncbi:hypothetical protein MRY82_09580, partial [bacterium]|nr:hypothetical protein [bacterium]
TAQTLLASKDGAQHTINICFNDEEYMGYFDDANFKNTATEKIKFFKRNEFNPIVIHNGADGQKHLNVEVSYRAYYTAYPDVVNNLKTVTKSHLIGELDQHTLFYQLNTDKSMYSICANPDLKPQIPVEDKKYARSLKRLQFLIPLDDLGNLHKNIESPVTVKIGARNIPTPSYEEYESLLLAQFSSLPYLIAGDMNVTSVEYVQHNQDVYKTLGAKIIASASPNVVSPHSADDNFDLANFESNMRQGSSEVSTEHPGQYFKQPQAIEEDLLKQEKENNPLYGTTVISNQEMISQCNNYAYRFGVSLNGRYTLLDYFDTTKQKLTDLSESVPKIKEILNDFFLLPIKHIANNTKRTTWNVYICSNTLETGILNDNAYIAFLDTMPNAPDEVSGVFKISKPHSSVVIESNDNKNKLLVGLDIVSFDLHDGDRVGEYMNLPSIVVSGIKKQQATRINFQFTGQFNLDSRDIRKASQTVSSRFHFADTVRRLKFEPSLDPINNTFEVVTEVRNTNPAVVIYDPITFHKNSLTLPEEKRSRNFPADIDPAQPFDGYLQTFGELNAFKFGFWLEG